MKITVKDRRDLNYIDRTLKREFGIKIADIRSPEVRGYIKRKIISYSRDPKYGLGTAEKHARKLIEYFVIRRG